MVALELEVLAKKFDRFGWDRDRGSAAHDRLILDWMDALQDYPLDEVRAACRAAIMEAPGRMPNEGHIRAKIIAARRERIKPAQAPDQPRARITADRAAEIVAEVGIRVPRFGGAQ
jgi:hypothetical protein